MNPEPAAVPPGSPGPELDIRTLRAFVAVAEELHFTRAAARLFVAQQALSRDIRRLERTLGVALFVRTTRRVTLTPQGERLLVRARELLALHDLAVREVSRPSRPLVVDLMSEGRLTAVRVLDAARARSPELEFRGRYGGGMAASYASLLAGDVDVAFGRADWRDAALPAGLERGLVRLEPLALLLPATHRLATAATIPLGALRDLEVDANAAHAMAPEWADLARQLLIPAGTRLAPPHLAALGPEETAHHLVRQGLPILGSSDHAPVPGGVVRPLVDPVPLYPWSMVRRRGERGAALDALEAAAAALASDGRWLDPGPDAWLPEPEASLLAAGGLPSVVPPGIA